jgi:hypothetical protein
MLKSSDIKFNRYISKFYTFTKWFHGKPTFLLSCVKKINFGAKKKGYVRDVFFVFFTQVMKNVGFSQNLMYVRRMLICKRGNFYSDFFDIRAYAPMGRIEFPI